MEMNDTTNPEAEAPEAEAPEVDTEDSENLVADATDENAEDGDEAPEEEEELDIDGNPLKVPKTLAEKLKARMMMQADYTQKTQTLAEQRRELEQQRQAVQWEAETKQALFNEEAQLLTVQQRLEQFQGINWAALAQQDMQQHAVMQAEYTQLKDYADRLAGHVNGRRAELNALREQETAITLERAISQLNTPKPDIGWDGKFDAEKRANLTKLAMDTLGYSNEEISVVTDPRHLHTLNLARIGYEALRKQNAALKTPTPQAQPVPQVATGKTRTGPVNPDRLSPDEWLKWRETQIAKKQQRNR
ncbi:MAG: hypothetical protein ACR2IL_06360 [Chitinophagaceae bacterium]